MFKMTPMAGSTSILSCLNCEKVFSLVDQLKDSMQDFEIFTMEMELDLRSAKSKSSEVLSNFWQLISTIQALKIGKEAGAEKDLSETQTLTRIVVTVEQPQAQIQSQNLENENKPVAKSESNPVEKMSKMRRRPQQNRDAKPNPNPNMTPKRLNELKRAKALLRTIKCETGEGFYNLFECLKCQRQFTTEASGLRHVQNVHLKLAALCPTCYNPFFTKTSLDLHISKCSQKGQFKKIKVWLKKDSKKPVKVHFHPHQKQEQSRTIQNQNEKVKSNKKVQNKRGKPRKTLDPLKVKVRNPFKNFSLKKALSVKVKIERLKMDKTGEEVSIISQILTSKKTDIDGGKEMTSSEFIAAGKELKNMS